MHPRWRRVPDHPARALQRGGPGAAEEIRRRVEEHAFERDAVSVKLTLSLGVATYPEDGEIRAADEALYRIKRSVGIAVSA